VLRAYQGIAQAKQYQLELSFVGVGISHSVFGGVALGLLWGVNPILTGGIFATLVAWVIGFVSRHGGIQEDVSIGIFFSAAMAFGIAVAGLNKGCLNWGLKKVLIIWTV